MVLKGNHMPRNMTTAEKSAALAIKSNILAAKASLRAAVDGLTTVGNAAHSASQFEIEAGAMALRGAALEALGRLDSGHSQVMLDMVGQFTDAVDVLGGGGGR